MNREEEGGKDSSSFARSDPLLVCGGEEGKKSRGISRNERRKLILVGQV